MKHGFLRVAAATPEIKVADTIYNCEQLIEEFDKAVEKKCKLIVLPELCVCGYTCNDLFLQDRLLEACMDALKNFTEHTKGTDCLAFVGLPMLVKGKLYNVAAAVCGGRVLAFIPKYCIPNYSEFYEARYFAEGNRRAFDVKFTDKSGESYDVPMGTDILLRCTTMPELTVAAEICEDVWMPDSPSIRHAMAGATVIVNLSASDETTGKSKYRKNLIKMQSAKLVCTYIYADAGEGESTQDLVFAGHNIIAENGTMLATSQRFKNQMVYADTDLGRIKSERRRIGTFATNKNEGYRIVDFDIKIEDLELKRFVDNAPFVPGNKEDRDRRCEEILSIQAMGLKKRLEHTNCKQAVIGISGGLDSTLALLVIARAFDALDIPRKNIQCITMPCFGTTDRTYSNACNLTKKLGATLTEIDIKESVMQHFKDIGHDPQVKDVTYENAQARERTQILMDVANQCGGMVIGTGDLSELALGWATYNGDHMSMYGVNGSVPKTLVRHLVRYFADTCGDEKLASVLYDVLDTPVSPELLPPEGGKISQKTEDIVGPYELHDFFLYYVLRFGYEPAKVYRLACHAFKGVYDGETILKWLKTFYRRFFSQQFKRSCLPDGPKVGSVAVSPRGDLRMPSDACSRLWLEELEKIQVN
ncbi:MAG: NAD(+) synthase [Lachnospiraceae bacterium]|nr:NAD(+) synthase [Lachnospiraceae bacterium]